MDPASFRALLVKTRDRHHRKDHPFFRAWASGELSRSGIQVYVQQHHHLATRVLPCFAIASGLAEEPDVRRFLAANLAEEEDPDAAHDDLLVDLGETMGLSRHEARNGPVLPTTEGLVDFLFAVLMRKGPLHFVAAACVGLESQGPAMYRGVVEAMCDRYGVADRDMVFLTLHIEADEEHGDGGLRLLERHATHEPLQQEMIQLVNRSARMGWFHLDGMWLEELGVHTWVPVTEPLFQSSQ